MTEQRDRRTGTSPKTRKDLRLQIWEALEVEVGQSLKTSLLLPEFRGQEGEKVHIWTGQNLETDHICSSRSGSE